MVTYICILKVDNTEMLLRPGMTATADIVTLEVEDAVLVPNAALRFTPTLPQAPSASGAKDNRSFISKIMPGPPRRGRQQNKNGSTKKNGSAAGSKVWVLEEGIPAPRPVTVGPSDGQNTQIVSGDLEAGTKVIIGQEATGG